MTVFARKCKYCGIEFNVRKGNPKIFCTHRCYSRSLLIGEEAHLGSSPRERAARWRKRNIESFYDLCPDCNGKKQRFSKRCRKCNVLSRTGVKSPFYKGGYELKLKHNRERAFKIKIIGAHTEEQWNELKLRYNFMYLCCKQSEPMIQLSRDHILPISKGGTDVINNIQPLCRSCNSRKYNAFINFIELHESAGIRV